VSDEDTMTNVAGVPRTVGLEEHFATPDVLAAWQELDPRWQDLSLRASTEGPSARRLLDLGEQRMAAMDETGLDVQVVSLTTPGLQNLERADAVALQGDTNDQLAEGVRACPDRLQGLAALATQAPELAAAELDRGVRMLGLRGAILFGRTRARPLDHPDFWPIFEAAQALNAPLYLHPQSPPRAVREAYYDGLPGAASAALACFGLGWHYEAGVTLLRLILSGVFDRFPDLQIIVGHWGEVVLFYLERIEKLEAFVTLRRPLAEYFRHNVWLTPGGMFSTRYLRWASELVGIDRLLLATDYPYEFAPNGGVRRFLQDAELNDTDRLRVASGNWDRLCAGIKL
jgi:uncharacterized protein